MDGGPIHLEHGEIDDKLAENTIRPTAVGKKNCLFISHPEAEKQRALIYTFLISTKAQKIQTSPSRASTQSKRIPHIIITQSLPSLATFFLMVGVATAITIDYEYDKQSRLTKVDYGDSKTIHYAYDAPGATHLIAMVPATLTTMTTPILWNSRPARTRPSRDRRLALFRSPCSGQQRGH